MFDERDSSGKHLICDIKGIKNYDLLNSSNELKNMLNYICDKFSFQILQTSHYDFTPQGCSILFLLSESHISIHSFPERKHMSLDLYTCRNYENNKEYEDIYNYLIETLSASKESTFKIIDRFF
jgi:S-adenosylmethionine decarboxylase proenzyme